MMRMLDEPPGGATTRDDIDAGRGDRKLGRKGPRRGRGSLRGDHPTPRAPGLGDFDPDGTLVGGCPGRLSGSLPPGLSLPLRLPTGMGFWGLAFADRRPCRL